MMKNYRVKLRSLTFVAVMLCALSTWAQRTAYVIKGKVSDASGGVPGATVKIDGTSFGTMTDIEGSYTLNANLNSGRYKISVSSVGYATKVEDVNLENQTVITLDVTLKDDVMNLDEVVVTGSTIRTSRRELGNAISAVNADQLKETGSSNLVSALQGKVPGAQITQNSGDPAGGITVRLRGVKSIQGSSDPLYVIDGVIVSNSSANVSQTALGNQVGAATIGTNRLADINPSDIESINVINGAAAAAQYGSRAANGVVLITTKRGKSGTPRITFTTSVNANELRKKVFISTYGKQFGFAGLRLHTIGVISPAQIAANPGTTVVGIQRDGTTSNLANNLVDVRRYDYQDQIFRTGYGTDNNVSISGGTDKTQYFASLSYMKNEGIIKGTDFNRYGVRARVDQRLANWAKMSVGLSYTNSFSNEKANGNVFYSPINSVNITNNIYDITVRDAAGNLQAVEPTRVNPLTTIEAMKFTQAVNRTVNDFQLNLTPFKGFSIDWIVGVDAYAALGKNYIPAYPYQAVAGLPAERYPNGYASNANNNSLLFNTDLNFSYQRELSKDFTMSLIAGGNYQSSKVEFARASGENLAPFIETVSGAASTTVTAGFGLDQYNLSGVFGQATFGYKNLAFITGAIRQDRSSKFSPSETKQLYPKLSGSFVPSDLDFWKNSKINDVLSGLKLRASWGEAGNLTGIGSYDRFWQFLPVPLLGKNTIIPSSTLANPSVRPERMTETEGGADLSFWKNKINVGVTVYKQKISDLVVNRVLAATTGGTSIVNNVGTMENKGLEIALNVTPIKTKDFNWDFTLIYNRNRNKVISLGSPTVAISNSAGAPVYLIQGQPASVFYEFPYARNSDGSLLLTSQGLPQRERGVQAANSITYTPSRDAQGQPSYEAGTTFVRTIIGNPNPDWTGSFVNSLGWKNFNFRFLLDAVQGVSVFNADKRTRNNVGIGDIAEKEMTGELPRGYVFSLANISEYRVDNGSFVKLRELSFGYQLPNIIKGISNINISLVGRNLASWDKYNGYDPETNAGGNNDLLRNVDFGNVPIPKTYQIQLTATF
ncbi:SusC/RagA family TonB-linked outer membrane protein [Emticicia sp. BO119]|uniref:SusC/RagA family TonB-linked outer membrane protein n=1 Tax=Emticicia sp. BO119 TaxID=2757768 RepID=UPI0015F0AECB|nr:SusC/RagA family TonB-linked outer membrane protein [Emticicia sp. BO119]MBA4850806.1 SusC/RagA family TonB-linked outer membrane protein [Emticicia sp. BO119]